MQIYSQIVCDKMSIFCCVGGDGSKKRSLLALNTIENELK